MEILEHSVYFGVAPKCEDSDDTGNADWATGGTTEVEGNIPYDEEDLIHLHGSHTRKGLAKGVNTWSDWHLVPSSRPEIAPPEVYTNYVDLPGVHGKLDLSEYLTGYPVYKNRAGSLEFYAANGYGFWAETYNEMCNFLHGKKLFMVLYDEPEYFYTGRFRVQQWNSDGKTNWSTVTIDYELDPFKFLLPRDTRDAYWDRFLFEDIHGYEFMHNLHASSNTKKFSIPGYHNGFMLDAFINENSSFPATATVKLNNQTMTLSRSSASSHTVRSGSLNPVINETNEITVSGNGSAYVDLVCWGGHL